MSLDKKLFREIKMRLAELLRSAPMTIEQRQDAVFEIVTLVLELDRENDRKIEIEHLGPAEGREK